LFGEKIEPASLNLENAMIEDRLEQIETAIERSPKMSDDAKAELLGLVAGLKAEIKTLSETHHEEASSITRFADVSAHEASRSRKNPQLAETALDGLRGSIQGLEDSHPSLVETVNRFATALSNMGL
jgi:ABC-type transporter Mla subunit MlaD